MATKITDEQVALAEAHLARLMGTKKREGAYIFIQGLNGTYQVADAEGNVIIYGVTRAEALNIVRAIAAGIEYARGISPDRIRL